MHACLHSCICVLLYVTSKFGLCSRSRSCPSAQDTAAQSPDVSPSTTVASDVLCTGAMPCKGSQPGFGVR